MKNLKTMMYLSKQTKRNLCLFPKEQFLTKNKEENEIFEKMGK